jgi:adiponectin receptor
MITRRATFSYLRSLKSVFGVHNETVNIWSHILGTAAFFSITIGLYLSSLRALEDEDGRRGDDAAIYVYFGSVIACFFLSFM